MNRKMKLRYRAVLSLILTAVLFCIPVVAFSMNENNVIDVKAEDGGESSTEKETENNTKESTMEQETSELKETESSIEESTTEQETESGTEESAMDQETSGLKETKSEAKRS